MVHDPVDVDLPFLDVDSLLGDRNIFGVVVTEIIEFEEIPQREQGRNLIIIGPWWAVSTDVPAEKRPRFP